MTINWNTIWMNLFGRTELFGINMGFWAAITVTGLIVILMNMVFWTRKSGSTVAGSSKKSL